MTSKKNWRTWLMCAVLLTPTAFAQQSMVDHCRNTSSDAERIACLEAALLGKELEASPPKDDVAEQPVVEAAEVAIAQETVEPVGIGAEQVIARNQTREDILEGLEEARGLGVASYDIVPYERLLVRLENGQVWRQVRGDNQRIRADLRRNQTVDITESSLGGYKLRLNEMRRIIRVERVK